MIDKDNLSIDILLLLLSMILMSLLEIFLFVPPAACSMFTVFPSRCSLCYCRGLLCGYGQFVPDTEVVDNYIAVPEELRGKRFSGRLAASRIRGDFM